MPREARGKSVAIRPVRAVVNHATTEVFFENLEVSRRTSSARRARAPATSSTAWMPSAS
jgi:hypothetical protein